MNVVSLFDTTGNAVKPWAEAGYLCYCFDLQNKNDVEEVGSEGGKIIRIKWDALEEPSLPKRTLQGSRVSFMSAFPPCTDLAVSGARWFKHKEEKNPNYRKEAMSLVYIASETGEHFGCSWYLENPVSVISTEWRKPDYRFHPHQYTKLEPSDNYTKLTCLWTGNGFVMPTESKDESLGTPDDRIHKAAPGPERANFRSATPMGFARAVFEANKA